MKVTNTEASLMIVEKPLHREKFSVGVIWHCDPMLIYTFYLSIAYYVLDGDVSSQANA